MAKKRRLSLARYGSGAIQAARGAYKIARRLRTRTRTRVMGGARGPAPMTSQHDSRLVYRKKTMPRYKKKKWVSFKKKVTAVEYSNRNLQNVSMIQTMYCNANTDRCSFTSAMIYGINGQTGGTGAPPPGGASGTGSMDDMYDVLVNKYAAGGTAMNGRKFLFGSAVMDVHATNVSENALILEVYEIEAKKTYTPATVAYDGPEDLFIQGFVDYSPMANTPLVPSALRLGTTPFNCKLFCQYFTVKTKRRLQVSPGEVVSFQIRDSTNRFIAGNMLGKPNVGWRKGECKGYFFQIYGSPQLDPVALPPFNISPACSMKFSVIKSYSFKQLDSDPIQYGHVEDN